MKKTKGSLTRCSTQGKLWITRTLQARHVRRTTDEGSRPRLIGDFNMKYLCSGQWPVPALPTFNTLKQTARDTYTHWVEARTRIEALETQLATIQKQQTRSQAEVQELQQKYSQTKQALEEALGLCDLLAQQLSNDRAKGHKRFVTSLY